MAVAAILGVVKALWVEELAVSRRGVGREEGRFLAEGVVVSPGDRIVECGGWSADFDGCGIGCAGIWSVRRWGGRGRVGRGCGVSGRANRPCDGERQGNERSQKCPAARRRVEHRMQCLQWRA